MTQVPRNREHPQREERGRIFSIYNIHYFAFLERFLGTGRDKREKKDVLLSISQEGGIAS